MLLALKAVLALASSLTSSKMKQPSLSGTVIDSGDGGTYVVPVHEGYVIGSSIKTIPIAGKDLTQFVQKMMRDRGEQVPAEDFFNVAQQVKENHCYTCSDITKEYGKFDSNPDKYVREISGVNKKTNQPWNCKLGHERFLTPEVRCCNASDLCLSVVLQC